MQGTSRTNDSPATSRALTAHGVRQLVEEAGSTVAITVQVLSIYRYMVDPTLRTQMGQSFQDTHDVFDVLVSDGRTKIKTILDPSCHRLVYTRALQVQSIIRVYKFKVVSIDAAERRGQKRSRKRRSVVVLEEIDVVPPCHKDGNVCIAGDPQKDETLSGSTEQLEFLSVVHPREVELLPLVGRRVYYLPLRSDHYALDWACSFTGGKAEEDSPLDELEKDWTRRYGVSIATNVDNDDDDGGSCNGLNEVTPSAVVAWNTDPEYCSDLFTPECKRVFTILEVLEKIQHGEMNGGSSELYPPMLGVIRVKSQLINLGDPDIANPFPFAFNAVVVDSTGVFEVLFLDPMCAKYYLSLHEGDLIQFRGYSTISPHTLQTTLTTSPLIYYGPGSSGSALHVPRRYWKVLEMTEVAPRLLQGSDDISSLPQQTGSGSNSQLRPSWLECSFVTTLSTLHWDNKALGSLHMMYFDFVGVLSNVGKVCLGRNRNADDKGPRTTVYRWVKMIDSSSPHELVVRVSEGSQPAVFRSLKAGNTLMVTKLQWVVLSGANTGGNRIQYATTSEFSVLRVNEAVTPYLSIEECSLNSRFASNVRKNAVIAMDGVTKESSMITHTETKYRPRNRLPTGVEEFKQVFGLTVSSLSDLSMLQLQSEAYEYRHVGFVGQVRAVIDETDPTKGRPPILLQLSERENTEQMLTVAVTSNALYQRPSIKRSVKAVTPPEALPLIRLLPAAVIDDIYVKVLRDRVRSSCTGRQTLSLPFIEEYLVHSDWDYFFSLRFYRDGIGHVTWTVDAILVVL
uniref:CST complex subunit CTC1 n=1 Tax=Peronospora matthiolae TaxID=2874970 RepID=A0AAV1UYI7_9STRA